VCVCGGGVPAWYPRRFPRRAAVLAGIRSHVGIAGLQTAAGSKAGSSVRVRRGGISRRILSGRHLRVRGRRVVRCSGSGRFIPSLPHSAAGWKLCVRACVPCASVHKIGREGAAAVASRLVGVVGPVDLLRHHFHQSPSRRPEQSEQLQWPFRVRLCGGGAIKAPDGRRKRRARGERGVGTGAPASLRGRLPRCRALPALLTSLPLSKGMRRLGRQRETR
jgi:hypothetical protein